MIENLENEEWKIIDGFDGMYLISNYGRLKSLKGKKERILKTFINCHGYEQISILHNKQKHKLGIHRLVAMAFIDNSNNYPVVNHKDEVKTNNHVSNLEWCTVEYNNNYGTRNQRLSELNKGANNPNFGKHSLSPKRKVIQLTLDENYIKTWDGIREIERTLGVHHSHISDCCKGKRKSIGGYKWQYAT